MDAATPEQSLGTVIGDLNSRRGHVLRFNEHSTAKWPMRTRR